MRIRIVIARIVVMMVLNSDAVRGRRRGGGRWRKWQPARWVFTVFISKKTKIQTKDMHAHHNSNGYDDDDVEARCCPCPTT